MVLDTINTLAKVVVLQVQKLEAGMDVLDEGADKDRQLAIAESHSVDGQAAQLVGKVSNGEQILLGREVEDIAIFDVDGNWRMMIRIEL